MAGFMKPSLSFCKARVGEAASSLSTGIYILSSSHRLESSENRIGVLMNIVERRLAAAHGRLYETKPFVLQGQRQRGSKQPLYGYIYIIITALIGVIWKSYRSMVCISYTNNKSV